MLKTIHMRIQVPLDAHFLLPLDGDTKEGQDAPVVPATTCRTWPSVPGNVKQQLNLVQLLLLYKLALCMAV